MTTRKFNQLLVSLGVTITLLTNAYPQAARTVMVQSNSGVLLFPTNLWSANASSARSGLSLATHATNPIVPVTSGGSGATNAATARTNFGLVWSGLTNSNAADFRSALSLSLAALTNTNNATFLTAIGFGTTNSPSLAGLILTNGTNNLVLSASASESRTNLALGWVGLTNTNASGFRSALELSASWLTNTNVTNFRTAIGLGAANDVEFQSVIVGSDLRISNGTILWGTNGRYAPEDNSFLTDITVEGSIAFANITNAATTRTNLGLGATNDVTFGRILVGSSSSNRPSIGYPTSIGTNPAFHGFSWDGLYYNDLTYHHLATSVTNVPVFRVGQTNLSMNVPVTFGTNLNSTTNLSVQFAGTNIGFAATTGPNVLYLRNGGSEATLSTNGHFSAASLGALVFQVGAGGSISFTSDAAPTRTNLGLGLPALTNTSNATMMRALAGSTNTNHPYSGTVSVVGTNNTNTLTFSNGILQSVQ